MITTITGAFLNLRNYKNGEPYNHRTSAVYRGIFEVEVVHRKKKN